ncbi:MULTISPECIES: type 2 isopentenyl-diphosphate Delta-isomerase [Aneurinibacillus]|jgi:isopentenyl-diphosphate delta-isomerase|uniref:Isopentenyl-diphosphate delta-isomerase n=1 Tax=Aneurinibacillus thermoaerophilus TaxID=143495 RepID=A0A1G7XJ36_ANETH|nr:MULTISPECIES: type 2 isopentenyl-diphosphate Delta-isomerase [Aneurinibacillus]AMA73594.1 type 2 isopentenyl-diphosphate Delta-isomerase [Aneurinibacillus sp. XH2]MED0674986.1 type 2 isopentenyl-diphosphate Delta-isomerase [Aneurinibacillus thermoaerophilus]MED0679613.1 type 2 isopentenyl-diphosphate Delta-isomerase [Aneurinibacillus thermoaerophilus]MED0737389.1 type 2 isopentenyl-diphosphate Delta-isomerase [Aneurinibacillus thermoaerophilus]MED0756238.1 type 2 isopentenyl-diphosphate Del
MSRTSRKREHVEHALATGQSETHGLDDVKFVHNCLPDLTMQQVDIRTSIGGLALSSPIVINAMTGGAKETYNINQSLGILAREAGLALAVGSQMAAVKDPSLVDTYRIARQEHPRGLLFANLGAEATPDMARYAVEMIEADALQIHLNVMQELIMPEGERDFRGALRRIEEIVSVLDVPVIVKEVGFGMSQEAAKQLAECGVAAIDVGGRGGTNFARIENMRRVQPLDMLNEWGISTAASLLEVASLSEKPDIVATGGIKNGLDIARCLALGASCVGIAGAFLRYAVEGRTEEAVKYVHSLHEQLTIIMTALGAPTIAMLQQVPLVITGETYHWATLRGIDCAALAKRKK